MQRSTLRKTYELLSSMRFAISLLTVLAIASIIGTVIKQNEPYNNYLNQFGPFWFPVFEKLGLYAVYNAAWFLLILGFLVLSTGACIVRQTRPMLKDMRSFREHARETSLAAFQHHALLAVGLPFDEAARFTREHLIRNGFRFRENVRDDGVLFAGRQGSWSRIGYFLAHAAILLICLGGLLDGNLPLKVQMALGGKHTTSGNQLIADIGPESRLGRDNWSFRGNVFVPEGKSSNVAVLNVKDGILLQDLPFTVSLRKFTLEHYDSGMPKRFASDVLITGADGKTYEKTIEVNKPVEVDGIMLYQASFEDGGSRLRLLARDLRVDGTPDQSVDVAVGDSLPLKRNGLDLTLELIAFRPFNVENLADPDTGAASGTLGTLEKHLGSGARSTAPKDLHNVGPSFQYKLRDNTGQAREYQTYMQPIAQDGAWYLLAGMRDTPDAPFRFMRIPVDADQKADAWFALRRVLLDPRRHDELARRFAATALDRGDDAALRERLQETARRTLDLFARGGFESVGKFIESTIPEGERDRAAGVFIKVLEGVTWEAWQLARQDAGLPPLKNDAQYARFVRDSLNAASDSQHYGAPLLFQLDRFDEVRATVLQATRSPGKPIVYLGSLLLVLGVFAMLYIRERRLFVLVKHSGEALVALSSNRKSLDVDTAFAAHRDALATRFTPPADAPPAIEPR